MCGNIVVVNDFKFSDGNLDVEGFERECIVLFEEKENDENYLYVCPITTHYKSFRRNPDKYYMLPLFTKNGNRFLFAKLSSVIKIRKDNILEYGDVIDIFYIKSMMELMKSYYCNYGNDEYYEEILHKMKEKTKVSSKNS